MRRILSALLLQIFFLTSGVAATVPVTPMQNAVSGAIQNKMIQRGFAANDPRFSPTLVSAGTSIAGFATGAAVVTLAGVTAPAWVTAAMVMGVGALVTWGINDFINWATDSGPYAPPAGFPAMVTGSPGHSSQCGGDGLGMGSTPDAVGYACAYNGSAVWNYQVAYSVNSCGAGQCSITRAASPSHGLASPYTYTISYSNITVPSDKNCSSGAYAKTTCITVAPYVPPTIQEAIDAVSPTDLAKPLNPEIVAAIANKAWQEAAVQPGYAGIPYAVSNPITATEVATQQSAYPSAWPTVGNALSPQLAPSGAPASTPWQLPNSATPVTTIDPTVDPNAGINPAAANPQANLGPDPGIGSPSLESTPTAQMILDPLLNLFPTLKTFTVPGHTAVCPAPSMVYYGQTLVLDGHCSLLEPVRPTLFAVMAFVWATVGLLVVLRA